MNPDNLYVFQADTKAWFNTIRDNGAGFVAPKYVGLCEHEPGLGKTPIALETVEDLIKHGLRGLFIVPGKTIIQWQRQFDKWVLECEVDEFAATSLVSITGSKAHIPHDACVVMSHALLSKRAVMEKLISAQFDFLVIDEAHRFGAKSTKRLTNLHNLILLTPGHFAKGRILLTGTSVRNYARESYNLFHILDPVKFRTYEDFKRRYLTYDGKALAYPQQFHADTAPYRIRFTVDQVQKDLPEIRRTKLYTELSDPFIVNAYNNQLDLMQNAMLNGRNIGAFSLLGYLTKMRHLTGIGKAKEPAIMDSIKEYLIDGERPRKVVLGIHHHMVNKFIRKYLKEFTIFEIVGGQSNQETDRILHSFIECDAPAIAIVSVKAGGEGVDGLQHAASKSYIFERQWNGSDEEQFERRIWRTGQTEKCHIEYTMAVGTIDEFFDDLVEEKRRITTQVVDSNWENNPAFIKELAERVIVAPRLRATARELDEEELAELKIKRMDELEEQSTIIKLNEEFGPYYNSSDDSFLKELGIK